MADHGPDPDGGTPSAYLVGRGREESAGTSTRLTLDAGGVKLGWSQSRAIVDYGITHQWSLTWHHVMAVEV